MGYSLLIVDDSKSDRYIIERFAQKSGQFDSIKCLEDGQEAYQYFLQEESKEGHFPPDVVILDVNMPRMNGFEFLEKYKEHNKEKDIKTHFVVMLTSSAHSTDKEKANEFGEIRLYLTKPFKKEYVNSIIKELERA